MLQLNSEYKSSGFRFIGFIPVENGNNHLMDQYLKKIGSLAHLRPLIKENNVEEVVIALESSEHESIGRIINELEDTPVIVRIIPDMYDILAGSVKMNAIFGAPLIAISPDLMPVWQQSVKRGLDIILSLFVLVFFFPLYLFTAIGVLISSPGQIGRAHV